MVRLGGGGGGWRGGVHVSGGRGKADGLNLNSYHLNVTAEIETHQTRQCFSNLLLSNFGEPVRIVASVSCS